MKRQDYISWDEYFMGIALLSAMRSKDNNSQVGACIVSPENKILSLGYNGMPIGCNDDELPYEERCKLNYDHPDSFDTPLMVAHLRELRAGHPVQVPVYDYTIHNRSDKTVTVQPAPVIIVEGILIFDSPELCDLMDMKVFVDTDADVRILRRIVRDVKERGRTLDSVVNQYLTTVKPMHEQFVEPSKRKADLIVPEGGHNLVALELLIKWVDNHLHAVEAE